MHERARIDIVFFGRNTGSGDKSRAWRRESEERNETRRAEDGSRLTDTTDWNPDWTGAAPKLTRGGLDENVKPNLGCSWLLYIRHTRSQDEARLTRVTRLLDRLDVVRKSPRVNDRAGQ